MVVKYTCTVNISRMSHRKWRESEQQLTSWLDLALPGCCLVCLHILCDILLTFTVPQTEFIFSLYNLKFASNDPNFSPTTLWIPRKHIFKSGTRYFPGSPSLLLPNLPNAINLIDLSLFGSDCNQMIFINRWFGNGLNSHCSRGVTVLNWVVEILVCSRSLISQPLPEKRGVPKVLQTCRHTVDLVVYL